MTITKEAYVDLQEKYEKIKKLIEEDSKLDPENEPYLSKYSARQLLIGMKANIENLLRSQTVYSKEHIKLTAMLGTTLLYLGRILIETEERSVGEKHLNKCWETITNYEIKPEMILVTLNTLNEFGLLCSEREPQRSKDYLIKAESYYKQFKETELDPIDLQDLFKTNIVSYDVELALKNLEKVHTLTLYYLAQIYGALKDALKSAVYCHITLKRQLQIDDYDLIEWALNAATLSQFFMEKNGFKQARHHLAASSYMLEIYENQLSQIIEHNEDYDAKVEVFKHRSADVARCWAKYGLLLLANSRDRLLKHSEDIDSTCTLSTDLAKLELNSDNTVSKEDLKNLTFETLNVTEHENQITDQFLLTIEDARAVFLNIKSWIKKAHSYYTLNNLASDYIEIVQDQAQMYANLCFFEDDPENQAKMHKRRVDLLEAVLKEINPTYYMQYCKQMWFEVAQAYSEILCIKIDNLKSTKERPSAHILTKINKLVDKSILNYNNFINSFKDTNQHKLQNISAEYQKPVLQAYFHVGALYSRYISLDKQINLQHVQASLEAYKTVVKYCEKHPEAEEMIPTEINICREMIMLLPIKIDKLTEEIAIESSV